jgi:transcriptional regulator with XRE-family HTH domain
MVIGDRLRALREAKSLLQGEIEKRTVLLRCYISRVENGHTVPAIPTLEKLARAMEVRLYRLFYDGENIPKTGDLPKYKNMVGPCGLEPQTSTVSIWWPHNS